MLKTIVSGIVPLIQGQHQYTFLTSLLVSFIMCLGLTVINIQTIVLEMGLKRVLSTMKRNTRIFTSFIQLSLLSAFTLVMRSMSGIQSIICRIRLIVTLRIV